MIEKRCVSGGSNSYTVNSCWPNAALHVRAANNNDARIGLAFQHSTRAQFMAADERSARTRACRVETYLDARLGFQENYKQASRRVSMRHARVRAPHSTPPGDPLSTPLPRVPACTRPGPATRSGGCFAQRLFSPHRISWGTNTLPSGPG